MVIEIFEIKIPSRAPSNLSFSSSFACPEQVEGWAERWEIKISSFQTLHSGEVVTIKHILLCRLDEFVLIK